MLAATRLVCLLSLLLAVSSLAPTVAAAGDAPEPAPSANPTLSVTASPGEDATTAVLRGEGFTPDGAVYVALFAVRGASYGDEPFLGQVPLTFGPNGSVDPAADRLAAVALRLTATATNFGPNGSQDPAIGYRHGGTVATDVAVPCGAPMVARAYDRGASTWSNWVEIPVRCPLGG